MRVPPWAPVLSDGTVTLRAHSPEDADAVRAQCSDHETGRWTTVPYPYTLRDAQEFLAGRRRDWESGHLLAFAIEDGGRFAGTVDLRPDGAGGAHVGYGLGPWARGRGVMSRALRLVLPWGFDTLQLEAVHWQAVAGNWPSRRAAWAVGFRVEGTVRAYLPARGGDRVDAWIGSLCRGDRLTPAHPWLDPPVLHGPRAMLRPHRPDDVEAMAQACNDPLVLEWLPQLPSPYTTTDARAHLEQITEEQAAGNGLYWAVCAPGGGPLLGEIGLFGLVRGSSRSAELGYWAHPAGRGTGMTTDAVRLAARHALLPRDVGGLGLERVLIRAAEGNTASQTVARGAGFRPSGVDRRAELLRDGTVRDLLRFDRVSTDDLQDEAGAR